MSFTYTNNIPQGNQRIATTQPLIQSNFEYLQDDIGTDHNFTGVSSNVGDGYHTVIHQVTQGSAPAAISGVNQIFSMVPAIPSGGDTQLFALTGNGGLSQLTGHFASGNGYVWCSGLLLQWGTVALTSSSSIPVSFIPNFNKIFNIQVTRIRNPAIAGSEYIFYVQQSSISPAGFNIISQDGETWSYNWFAIGN